MEALYSSVSCILQYYPEPCFLWAQIPQPQRHATTRKQKTECAIGNCSLLKLSSVIDIYDYLTDLCTV